MELSFSQFALLINALCNALFGKVYASNLVGESQSKKG
jgi:hypothetical protein